MHLWIDSERYVPLKMRMGGAAREGGEERQMRIERENTAYRTGPWRGVAVTERRVQPPRRYATIFAKSAATPSGSCGGVITAARFPSGSSTITFDEWLTK